MDNIETLLAAVAQTQGFDDDDEPVVSTAPEQGLENSESSPVIPGDSRPSAMVDMPHTASTPVFPAAGRLIGAGERRKRGRPPKGRQAVKLPPTKRNKPEDEEEDVCFICFDGGSLVLCDRKGCPKAYHPACIKRDEAFFKSKAKWNCGWHICSVCRKTSYYMCYTCTYSLCKGCTKDADYLRVRGNKGFCSTCMKTIMLIENKDQANNEIQVDFDDETSWEYLFKVYWVILKEKLSLTLCDLARAKKPWKGVATVGYKPMPSNVIPTAVTVEVTISHSRTEHLELNKPHEEINNENGGDGPEKSSTDEAMQETNVEKATDEQVNEKNQDDLNAVKDTEWASKELLEFVAIVKNGDVSAMSRFDVQTLLLDYVNRNGLWDTRRKSRIMCDPTLEKLFGKKRVGHVEMLKLLESHFLVKEDSQKNIFIPAGFVSSVESDVEVDESEEDMGSGDNSKRDEYANAKPSYLDSPQNGSRPISPNNEGKEEKPVEEQNITNETTGTAESNSSDKQTYQDNNITHLATDDRNTQKDMQTPGLEASTATASVGNSPSSNFIEIEKLWHYRDPDGKIRGPFSMMQLREWSTTGLYLPDMRIWTNHEQYDSLCLSDALSGKFHGASDFSNSGSREEGATGEIGVVSEGTNVSGGDSKQIETTTPSNVDVLSEKNNTGVERADEPGSWPQCWDFLKDDNNNNNNKNNNNNVHSRNLLSSSNPEKENEGPPVCGLESNEFYRNSQNGEKNSTGFTQSPIVVGREVQNQANNEGRVVEENLGSLNIDLSSNGIGLSKSPDSDKQGGNIPLLDFPSPARPNIAENGQSFGFLELLTRPNNEDQAGPAIETKNSGFLNFSMPNSGQMWNSGLGAAGGVQIPDLADDWCKFPTGFSLRPPEITDSHHQLSPSQSNVPNWLANINEPIEFDALGEEYVSDLLAEVDAMESQGPLHSPNSAIKFAREFLEDCKDDCFSSIEEFSSSAPDPRRSDALSSTSETQLNFTSCSRPIGRPAAINAFDSLTRSNVHSSASSEGETNNNNNAAPNAAQDVTGGGASSSMGSINLVTVQGNVNLVLGGPAGQGMANIGWGSPNLNHGPVNGSLLPWDGQRGYSGERYTSPREWVGGYQGGRPPWGRQQPPLPYGGGGGYPRPVIPKGQRVCKFYESGRCKKGAFCDYLHP